MAVNEILHFHPIFQYRIWGGEKLKTVLNKKYDEENIGESWEISAVKGFESQLVTEIDGCTNLQELIEKFPTEILGSRIFEKFGTEFPLLIKFIDAKEPLSVQVHPNDEFAKKNHSSCGKTEMWYVLQADENAEIISGFTKKMNPEEYQTAIDNNTIEPYLNHWKVKKGDVIFLPAGRVHAIGAGILLAEIQQTSDITYRIYDYNRLEKDGKPRELHNDLAQQVIDFNDTENPVLERNSNESENEKLINCAYFQTNLLNIQKRTVKNYEKHDSFVILICVDGEAKLLVNDKTSNIKMGETVLIPAAVKGDIEINPLQDTKILQVYIP